DANGKIDRIRARAESNIGKVGKDNFSDFAVLIDSPYTLRTNNALIPPRPYELSIDSAQDPAAAALGPNEFWILLAEQPSLDTSATPQWLIDHNTSLRDSANDQYVVVLINPKPWKETPTDTAPPIFGYTLAAANKNQIFVHFSEPVRYDQTGDGSVVRAIQAGDFLYTGAAAITGLSAETTDGGDGTSEALLTLDSEVSATEIVTPATLQISAASAGMVRDKNPLNVPFGMTLHSSLVSDIHRVSDVGLGLVGDGLMEPVWAHDQTTAPQTTTGIGRINLFDGTKWLRDQDITLTGHVHNNIVANPGTKLWFDVGVTASLSSASGLWLPPFDSTTYNGIIPFQNPTARSSTGTAIGTQVREYLIPGNDSEIVDAARVEFLFQVLAGAGIAKDLFCARLTDPAAADWYRRVVPWAFDIHEIKMQKGNVTILNNVINPSLAQTVTLQYLQPTKGSVTISVFDLAGNLVRVLARVSGQAEGDYAITWDGKNKGGRSVARGIYFIRIVAPGIDEMRKVLVVR
ncbi:MAG: T9SS type A sorting domain-containing protein, partial [Candidatus Atribacteria bacterium]|nr:T9SS type A sorting domain-containing protein [Candidatus Atribacteria bacterium]